VDDPRAYMQVARTLREQIEYGRLETGRCLPGIKQLSQESGRSRQTIGKALRLLEREGLMIRVAGHPYYVKDAGSPRNRHRRAVPDGANPPGASIVTEVIEDGRMARNIRRSERLGADDHVSIVKRIAGRSARQRSVDD
jgi:DNA-binding GntR family transcriptional regulator